MLVGFVREERGVNAAEDDPGAALARHPADFVAAQRIARMDADADDVARGDLVMSMGSSVSSTRWGSPHCVPVAAARTYSHRGVMTATPNDTWLGLIR